MMPLDGEPRRHFIAALIAMQRLKDCGFILLSNKYLEIDEAVFWTDLLKGTLVRL